MKSKTRVAMLMSGGVDSSVAAALLKEQGYDVIGFYILGWLGTAEFPCPWQKEEADARAVADQLGIPFQTINLSAEYEREVIDRFFASYQSGATPNPDILCNREIKFKALWQKIRQFQPDWLATGHYASTQQVSSDKSKVLNKAKVTSIKSLKTSELKTYLRLQPSDLQTSHPGIFKPRDENKDQTYFLWGIDKTMVPKIIFPLSELTKPEVRALAKKYQLPTAAKKDSQGICFIGPLKVRKFLSSQLKTRPGEVWLADGRRVASHQGVELYTIGQRLAAGAVDWTGDVPPLFVIAKDIPNNRLIVGSDAATFATQLTANQANWLVRPPLGKFATLAKIRYRQEDVPVKITSSEDRLLVTFDTPVRAITPGQSIVFYANDGLPRAKSRSQLLGGAIIEQVKNQNAIIKRLSQTRQKATS